MSITKLNPLKRKIFNFFTGSLKNSKNLDQLKTLPRDAKIKVLISRPNHRLGNQLLLSPLIQEVKSQFPNSTVHLVVNGGLSPILFAGFPFVDQIIGLPKKPLKNIFTYIGRCVELLYNKYDLAVAGCENSNSSKIFVKLSRSKFKIYDSGGRTENRPEHIAQQPIYNLRTYVTNSDGEPLITYPKLSVGLTPEEIEKGRMVLERLFENEKKTIAIFTFATGAKCHSKEWWRQFYEELKKALPHYNIMEILPMENVSQIDFESVHYYSRDLREIPAVIENTALFIGADCGMMHLAAATNTTTLGLFNRGKSDVYGPYGDKNGVILTDSVTIEELAQKIKRLTAEDSVGPPPIA